MLILKSDKDLPISVRHLGHQIGANVKTLETSMHSDIDSNSYKKLIYLSDQHLYDMNSIGRAIKELGDEEKFELSTLYKKLEYLEADYHSAAKEVVTLVKEAYEAVEDENLQPILLQAFAQADRNFKDDIQISSVNRMERLQEIIDSTALSFIAGLLKEDISAMSYAETFGHEINKEVVNDLNRMNDSIEAKLLDGEIESAKDVHDMIVSNMLDEVVPELLEEVYQECAADLRSKYDDKFVPNESLDELKANAINVIRSCVGRGKPRTYLFELVAKEIDAFVEDFAKEHNLK